MMAETFSALLALCVGNPPVIGEFPAQRPVARSFDVFFDLGLNKRLSKQSWGWWSGTPSRSLWRHCDGKCRLLGCGYFILALIHPNNITWVSSCLKTLENRLFIEQQIQSNDKESIEPHHHWYFKECTNDWKCPLWKGQWYGKCFHVMTSSWHRGTRTCCIACHFLFTALVPSISSSSMGLTTSSSDRWRYFRNVLSAWQSGILNQVLSAL